MGSDKSILSNFEYKNPQSIEEKKVEEKIEKTVRFLAHTAGRRSSDDFYALFEKHIKVGKTTQSRERKREKMRSQSSSCKM